MAIEKLSVILELVTGNYKKEAREAATATGKIGDSAKSVTSSLGIMMGPAAIAGAVIGLGKLAMAAGENADRLFDLQAQTGLTTDAIQEWEFVAKAAGATTEVFSDAVKAVIRNLEDADGATGAAADAYVTLGISVKEANGELRDAGDITQEVFDKLAGMENITARNALAQDIFGKKWEETISILDLGSEALSNLREEGKEAVVSEEALRNADEFRETMDKLKATMGAQLNRAIGAIAPLLTDVAEAAKDIMDELEPLLEGLGWLSERFGDAKDKGAEMAESNNVVEAGWGRMIGEVGILSVLTGNYTGAIEAAIGAQGANVTSTDAMTGSWQRATTAITSSTAALDDHKAALAAADNAELSMLRAQEQREEASARLTELTLSGTASVDELRIAQLELNIATVNAQVATDAYNASLEALDGKQVNVTINTLLAFQNMEKEAIDDIFAGGKAAGGPVMAGRRYLVGELGPEMFIPQQSGSIVPNSQLGNTTNSRSQTFYFAAPVKPVDLQWISLQNNLETLVS